MKCLYSEKALNSIFFELWFVVLAYCYDTKLTSELLKDCKKATVNLCHTLLSIIMIFMRFN